MTSKRAPSGKRTTIPRTARRTREFDKDWELLSRTGRFDMNDLKRVMMLLIANDGPLPAIHRDHPLDGARKGFRDCHIHGDFLLL